MNSELRPPALVPELDVSDVAASIAFLARLGFSVAYARPEEGFAYLERGAAHVMLQNTAGPGRRFRTAPLDRPHGRGVNFQLEVDDVDAVHAAVVAGGFEPLIALEDRWYRVDGLEHGNRQFVVEDPDGYLWRPFQDLGQRPGLNEHGASE